MTHPLRGSLYWARLDKRRPVLIISSDRFNARSTYVTVVPVSTRLRPLITHVKLARGEGGLDRPSMLLCEHLQELHIADLDPSPMGPPLAFERIREVQSALRLYLELGS
jgi:mRNA-degrading endonuclease toxin of MazEF toxin-antitoxin module